jgi:hypothetical protein
VEILAIQTKNLRLSVVWGKLTKRLNAESGMEICPEEI